MAQFFQNDEITYICNKYVQENSFIGRKVKNVTIPSYEEAKEYLPQVIWEGHEAETECYDAAWKTAFTNIHNPAENSRLISPYIDAAFNGCIFMWDSCFMLMFGKFGDRAFPFLRTLDNFYALQHKDGFISKEISESDGSEKFTRFDPSSTGPNIMAWCEYEYYKITGDKTRLSKIFSPLLAYHQWFKENRTWRDGTYWSSGWGCGMDNMPRMREKDNMDVRCFSNGHMVWVDTCMQQLMNCNILIKIGEVCGRSGETAELKQEKEKLTSIINEKLWDEETGFYYDLWSCDEKNMVKTIGSYWGLLADVVPANRIERFVAHLENEAEFKRPNRVPTLSADNEYYSADGNYWCGSVWAPTNYMVLQGLSRNGYHDLAFDIAKNAVENVAEVYKQTGTIWENYSPEYALSGNQAKSEFVGWSGLFPISMLIEYVFGIELNMENNEIVWHIRLIDAFGVKQLPFGGGTVSLMCSRRDKKTDYPQISVLSDISFTLILEWNGQQEKIEVNPLNSGHQS